VLRKGDQVDCAVLSVDKESKKITLGVKQLGRNPWESIEKTMPVGSLVKGKVTKITAFGAFVELETGIEGLIHVTELSDQAFGKVEDVVAKGDEVTAKVIKLDPEHKKIALSIKEYLIDQNQVNRDDIVVTPSKRKKKESAKGKGKEEQSEAEETAQQESKSDE
jgi:small subunit ribosomal protein S1